MFSVSKAPAEWRRDLSTGCMQVMKFIIRWTVYAASTILKKKKEKIKLLVTSAKRHNRHSRVCEPDSRDSTLSCVP